MGLFDNIDENATFNLGSEDEYNFSDVENSLFTNKRQLRLKSLEILKKGAFKDQYIRNFSVKMGYEEMSNIENLVASKRRNGLNTVTGVDISLNAPNILDLKLAPTAKASISNGWSTERDIFMMEMVEESSTGYSETVYYIQGYTNYNGISILGNIDLDMQFFMNTIMVFNRQRNLGTGTVVAKMTAFFSVLHSDEDTTLRMKNLGEDYGLTDEKLMAARPEDIVGTLNSRTMFDGEDLEVYPSSILKVDGRNMEAPILSRKNNSITIQHMSSTLNSLLSAQTLSDDSFGRGDLLDTANTVLRMNTATEVEFLRQLAVNNGMVEKSYFTIKDLINIDNTIRKDKDQRIAFITSSNEGFLKDAKMDFSIGEDIYRPTEENKINSIVSSALTSLLSETGLELLALAFDNELKSYSVNIIGYRTRIEGWDAKKLALFAAEKFKNEIMPVITKNNQLYLMGVVTASLMDDTRLSVNIGNGMVDFINPTFADSLYSNNIADTKTYNDLSNGYDKIVDVVTSMA